MQVTAGGSISQSLRSEDPWIDSTFDHTTQRISKTANFWFQTLSHTLVQSFVSVEQEEFRFKREQ
jgi:hypothetical protein